MRGATNTDQVGIEKADDDRGYEVENIFSILIDIVGIAAASKYLGRERTEEELTAISIMEAVVRQEELFIPVFCGEEALPVRLTDVSDPDIVGLPASKALDLVLSLAKEALSNAQIEAAGADEDRRSRIDLTVQITDEAAIEIKQLIFKDYGRAKFNKLVMKVFRGYETALLPAMPWSLALEALLTELEAHIYDHPLLNRQFAAAEEVLDVLQGREFRVIRPAEVGILELQSGDVDIIDSLADDIVSADDDEMETMMRTRADDDTGHDVLFIKQRPSETCPITLTSVGTPPADALLAVLLVAERQIDIDHRNLPFTQKDGAFSLHQARVLRHAYSSLRQFLESNPLTIDAEFSAAMRERLKSERPPAVVMRAEELSLGEFTQVEKELTAAQTSGHVH